MSGERVLRIFESELDVITSEIGRYPSTETGGDLLGLWTHGDSPTIFLATRPGPGAVRRGAHFQQSPETHMAVERLLWERFGAQCVGIWHSHHHLGMPVLSTGDVARTRHYARTSRRSRFCEILGFYERDERIGLRPYTYRRAQDADTVPTRFQVLPGISPVRAALRGLKLPVLGRALDGPELAPPRVLHRSNGLGDVIDAGPPEDDALERIAALVPRVVPEPLHRGVGLHLPRDGELVLKVEQRERVLRVWIRTRPRLEVVRWCVKDARGILASGRPENTADVPRGIVAGLKALIGASAA